MSAAAIPASLQMLRMLTGYWFSQALYAAAKLRLADRLASGPRLADDLATECGAHPGALRRLLRALASQGVFAADALGRYRLTELAECLRSDVPGSQWAAAIMNGEHHFPAWAEIMHSLETGRPAFEKVYGAPIFDYLSERPAAAAIFDAAMTGVHGRETTAMLQAYDFAGIRTLIDLGGGNGSLLCAVLDRYPELRGVVFDLPHVVERTSARLEESGHSARCTCAAGSFFEAVPEGGDAYLLRHILHDWDDELSTQILRNCAAAMRDDARLLVIECVIPPGNDPGFGKLLDLAMLVLPGGLERTAEEFAALFHRSGLELQRIVPTTAEVCVIEARKR